MLGGQSTANWQGRERHPLTALDSPLSPSHSPSHWQLHRASRVQHGTLEQQLAADLLALSPKLQQVARYCLEHARSLHLCRILDVAAHCNTQPVTVVRLAKRYGFRGFLDFKMAFLAHAQEARPVSLDVALTHHTSTALAQWQQDLAQLEHDWSGAPFSRAVALLQRAPTVWIHHSPNALSIAHCYAALLRAAGCQVRWLEASGTCPVGHDGQTPNAARASGWSKHDVLLTLSLACAGEGNPEAVCMAQHMGLPVVALSDQPRDFRADALGVHLYVAELGLGLRGLSAGLLLVRALEGRDPALDLCLAP